MYGRCSISRGNREYAVCVYSNQNSVPSTVHLDYVVVYKCCIPVVHKLVVHVVVSKITAY